MQQPDDSTNLTEAKKLYNELLKLRRAETRINYLVKSSPPKKQGKFNTKLADLILKRYNVEKELDALARKLKHGEVVALHRYGRKVQGYAKY